MVLSIQKESIILCDTELHQTCHIYNPYSKSVCNNFDTQFVILCCTELTYAYDIGAYIQLFKLYLDLHYILLS